MVQMTGSVRCLDMRALCDAVSILEGDPYNPTSSLYILAALFGQTPIALGFMILEWSGICRAGFVVLGQLCLGV